MVFSIETISKAAFDEMNNKQQLLIKENEELKNQVIFEKMTNNQLQTSNDKKLKSMMRLSYQRL